MKLNEKQKRFADEYIIHGNAHKAAIEAGYSKTYAKTNSHKLLENTRISAYIVSQTEKLQSEKVANQQEVMEFLTAAMRGEVTEPILIGMGEGLQKLDYVKPNVNTRRQAAVDIGKRYAMWTDKQITDTTERITIVNDLDE